MSSLRQQRASRANGRFSHGPVTPEGQRASAQARLTLGLTAQALTLPGEDPEAAEQLAQALFDEFMPQGPQQIDLVERIHCAITRRRRAERAAHATLTEQFKNADYQIARAMEDHVAHCHVLYRDHRTKPRLEAVAGFRQTSLGCRVLIDRFTHLKNVLQTYGALAFHDVRELATLWGEALGEDTYTTPRGFWLSLHALWCHTQVNRADEMSVFGSIPPELVARYRQAWPDPDANRGELLRWIEEALSELRDREDYLRTGPEAVRRALAPDQALLIQDPQQGRLWTRYHAESQSTYFRSTRELRLLQAQEAEDAASVTEEAAREQEAPLEAVVEETIEPSEEISQPAPAEDFPNEPGAPVEESEAIDQPSPWVANSGYDSESDLRSMIETVRAGHEAGLWKESAGSAPR